MAHTPGPWILSIETTEDEYNYPYMRLFGGNAYEDDFATMGFELSGIVRPEDARLIAAAPDLFEALKPFLSKYEGLSDYGILTLHSEQDLAFVKAARAALAKATQVSEGEPV